MMLGRVIKMHIRTEREEDGQAIDELLCAAFAGEEEAKRIRVLRLGARYIPSLSLLIESGDEIVAFLMLVQAKVDSGRHITPALLLTPMCVKESYRGFGFGARLLAAALDRAETSQYGAVFAQGPEQYFSIFGFKRADSFGDIHMQGVPAEELLALELVPDALRELHGEIRREL